MGDLISKLGIIPKSKVCLIRPNRATLSQIRKIRKYITLVIDRMEDGCDVILYWIDSSEDIRRKMLVLQDMIKPDGRIWVIIPKEKTREKMKKAIDWNQLQAEILKTHLVDNKSVTINEDEYGTQFFIRK